MSVGTRSGLLYQVRAPAGSGIRPLAAVEGGTLRVGQTADGHHKGVATISIQLARGVRWTINLDGGATTETASVRLPAAVGTLTLTLAGGATQLLVVAPSGSPAQVKVVGGASAVTFDGVSHTGVAGGSVFTDPAWANARNRYAVDLLAGVSEFQLSRS